MGDTVERSEPEHYLRRFTAALESGGLATVRRMLNGLYPAEIANLLESLPPTQRELAWELVAPELEGDVLLHVSDGVRAQLIRRMQPHELLAATEGLPTDDLADFLQDLPRAVVRRVLESMSAQDRERVAAVLSYHEDTAGGLMNTDTVTVRPDVTLDVVLRYLRWRGELPEMTDSLIVVQRDDTYLGLLAVNHLLTKDPALTVGEVMVRDVAPIDARTPAREVASLFENRDLISAPVVDGRGRLVGRITIDDVVDVIREEAEHSLMSMAGLSEQEDLFAPVAQASRRRDREGRRARGADAHRREHGRHRRQPDADAGGARHGARPDQRRERAQPIQQRGRGRPRQRLDLGAGRRGDRGPVVR